MSRAKHWCFTINNYDGHHESELRELGGRQGVQYLVFGRETGDSGTPHLQGYVCFESRRTLRQVRQLVRGAHLEKAQGTPKQASDYCKKDGDHEEFGQLPAGQGTRTDISKALEQAKTAGTLRQLIEEHGETFIKYPRGLATVRLLYAPKRDFQTLCTVYWGDTGTGKTKTAHEEAPQAYVHPGGPWFDGYDGDEAVIFDDYGGSEFKITYFLKLLDRYEMRVPVKGGYVQWLPRRVFITANYHPLDWYPNAKDQHRMALMRRLNVVTHFRESAEGIVQETE